MTNNNRWILSAAVAATGLVGCGGGGGGGGGAPAAVTPPMVSQSPGGIWASLPGAAGSLTFYISEAGELWLSKNIPDIGDGPAFGAGTVTVSDDRITGSYEAKAILPVPLGPFPELLTCGITGSVTQRSQMTLILECSDTDGPVWEDTVNFVYTNRYEQAASLDTIAGNYTLSFQPATNSLNINSDGVVFGMYHNGPNCTVNGTVSLPDPAFNLYRMEWTLSNCVSPFPNYEGGRLSGVAVVDPSINALDSFYLLMTGDIDGDFRSVSVIYEPM